MDVSAEIIQSVVRNVVEELVRGNYDHAVNIVHISRLTSDDLREFIRDYGFTLEAPPREAYDKLDAIEVKGRAVPTWSIWAPLWTREEGRSDLTLELTISLTSPEPTIELDNLRVP